MSKEKKNRGHEGRANSGRRVVGENWEDQIQADRKRDADEVDAKIEKEFGPED